MHFEVGLAILFLLLKIIHCLQLQTHAAIDHAPMGSWLL